eukprot:626890-Prorocentrum_minimum.AAC.1
MPRKAPIGAPKREYASGERSAAMYAPPTGRSSPRECRRRPKREYSLGRITIRRTFCPGLEWRLGCRKRCAMIMVSSAYEPMPPVYTSFSSRCWRNTWHNNRWSNGERRGSP